MCKFVNNAKHSRIDKCMRIHIHNLNLILELGVRILASCCGHGKHPMTIVVDNGREIYDLVSGETIPRTRNFYKKDNKGYYYIPEVMKK